MFGRLSYSATMELKNSEWCSNRPGKYNLGTNRLGVKEKRIEESVKAAYIQFNFNSKSKIHPPHLILILDQTHLSLAFGMKAVLQEDVPHYLEFTNAKVR